MEASTMTPSNREVDKRDALPQGEQRFDVTPDESISGTIKHANSDVIDEPRKEDIEANITDTRVEDTPYSIFTRNEKRMILVCAGVCAFFSPVSGQIYFPALPTIAHDLDVSNDLVNLSITTYLIMQGLAPAFIGGFSDSAGRRPAYLICFIIYMSANLGLALQANYAALMVLRCLQSGGSSATIALASAVAGDLVTSQERGKYVSWMSVAPQAGPTLGPIIGGLLAQYLGWHAIFWFLLITAGAVFIPMAFLFPETCHKIVGDGSVPPPKLIRCYMNTRVERRLIDEGRTIDHNRRDELASERRLRFPNPLGSIKVLFMKEAGFAILYMGFVVCGLYATIAMIPSQFGIIYGFNEVQIALCFLPFGAGTTIAAFVRGRVFDARFRHHAKRLGYPLQYNRRVDLSDFPIERARLEAVIPMLALGSACIIGFGWMLQAKVHLAGPLIFLFVMGFCISASMNGVAVLLVDIFPGRTGTASAANNLCRCWLAAAATSTLLPLVNRIGLGWTTTILGLLPVIFSPILWIIIVNGPKWRKATKAKQDRAEAARAIATNADENKEATSDAKMVNTTRRQ